jgi:hypothetical protein
VVTSGLMPEPFSLESLLDLLHPERYRVTVYVPPDIDKAWLESQLPIDVEVVTSKYLTPGTAIVMPTGKRFSVMPYESTPVPASSTTVGETEEPNDEDDTGDDQQQGRHGNTETDEQDDKQKDKQQYKHGGLLSS